MPKELSVFHSDKEGYASLFAFEAWKIAMIQDSAALHRENIHVVSRHMQTDEAFTLLQGEAALFTGGTADKPGSLVKHALTMGSTYVVHAGTWHVTVTAPGCQILVVENADTGAANTEKCALPSDAWPQ